MIYTPDMGNAYDILKDDSIVYYMFLPIDISPSKNDNLDSHFHPDELYLY